MIWSAFGSARRTSSFKTRTPPEAMAPAVSSSKPGTRSLRTLKTSRGTASRCATSYATGTPPRGRPSTITSLRPAYCSSFSASSRPASARFGKAISMAADPPIQLRSFREVWKQGLHIVWKTMFHLVDFAPANISRYHGEYGLCGLQRVDHAVGHDFFPNGVEELLS